MLTGGASDRFRVGRAYSAKWLQALHQHLLGKGLKNYHIGFQVARIDDEEVLLSSKLAFTLQMDPTPAPLVNKIERDRIRTRVEEQFRERDSESNLLHFMHMYIAPFNPKAQRIEVSGEIRVPPTPGSLRTYIIALDAAVDIMGWIFEGTDQLDKLRNQKIADIVRNAGEEIFN